jgi:hypothetical protein
VQPITLTSASASTRLEYLLGFGGRPETSFGKLQIECGYDAAQLESLVSRKDFAAEISVTVHCRTIIEGNWYAAEAVCAFAAKTLREVLGTEAPDKIAVDAKTCQVSCTFTRRYGDASIQTLMCLCHNLFTLYSIRFRDDVAKIHPSAESVEHASPSEDAPASAV